MQFNDKIKKDEKIMALLGVTEIRHLIAHTSKGELSLLLRKGSGQYIFVLDAVPVEKDVNKELLDLLFPIKAVEIPQPNKGLIGAIESTALATPVTNPNITKKNIEDIVNTIVKSPKPKGRPKGSKNK